METQKLTNETKKDNSKKTRKVAVVLLVILLILFLGFLGFEFFIGNNNDKKLEGAVSAQLGQLENKSNEEIEAELDRVIDESSMAISINSNPVFVHGLAKGTLQIENSPANHYAQNVVITRDDNGEVIYESGLLQPNYHIQTDELDVDRDKGEYPCTATFTAYKTDTEDGKLLEVGSSGCKIKVTVLG